MEPQVSKHKLIAVIEINSKCDKYGSSVRLMGQEGSRASDVAGGIH
jgi:hypothetical protein